MKIFDIIIKLNGKVRAVGESNEDERRFENLKQLTVLCDAIITEIKLGARDRNRPEASMRKIGVYAVGYLRDLLEDLDETELS